MKPKKKTQLPPPHSFKKFLFSFCFAIIFLFVIWVQNPQKDSATSEISKTAQLIANQTNDDLTKTMSTAIGSAKESVLLIVYTLTDPTIISALKNKSREGVPVLVVCDAKESRPISAKLGEKVDVLRRFSPGRMHQKILVVDGKTTWIGSANMTTQSLRMHGNLITILESQDLAKHIHEKTKTINVEGHDRAFPHEVFNIGSQRVEMWFLPDDQGGVQCIKDLIQTAKKTIRIAMFTWTRSDLAEAVIDAARRGVNTEVVIDSYQGKGASARIVKLLSNSDVKVSLSRGGPLLHHKFLYIDNETLVNGSANWTHDAFTKNDDCFIVMHKLERRQQEQMDSLWEVICKESIPLRN